MAALYFVNTRQHASVLKMSAHETVAENEKWV